MRKFEAMANEVKLPQRSTMNSAGYDFFLPEGVVIKAKEMVIIKTKIRCIMEEDEFLGLFLRSSMGIKKGLRLCNQVGIIDKDYYGNADNGGEILVALENKSNQDVHLFKGEKFVQGVFMKYLLTDDDQTKTKRTGGLGSTN